MTDTLSPQEYDTYIRKNETWNFVVNMLDLTFFTFASSFIFGATVLSLYASYLTTSAMLIGLVSTIRSVGYYLPQLLLARQAELLPRKKPFIQRISIMERFPYLFVALGIMLWPDVPQWLAFAILILSLALATGSGGVISPAWKSMLAKVVRVERRGLLFGLSQALGGLLGIGGAAVSRYVLTTYSYPTSFGICFLLCFVFQVMSWVCLSLNREPAKAPPKGKGEVSPKEYWRRLPCVLKNNPNFCKYLLCRALIALGTMGTALYIVYARDAFQVTDAFAGNLTMAALISQTVSTPALGGLADRLGHKWLSEIGALIGVASVLVILVAPNLTWLYIVFMLMTASTSAMMVAGFGITMEFSDIEDVPTFEALAGTISAVPVLLAPLVGGWLVDVAGYQLLFVVALICAFLGWASMRWLVREPRHEKRSPSPVEA